MLPESAREELRRASRVPTDGDPLARNKAIAKVIDRLRIRYPQHFKEEADEPSDPNRPDQRRRPADR